MSSVQWILAPSSAPSSRKSTLACWPARGDKPVSSIDLLSLARFLSLSPFMSHDVVYMAMIFIGVRLVEGGGNAMWAANFSSNNTTGLTLSNGALTAHRQCSRMGLMTCMCRHASTKATHLMTCKHVMA
jgi:hypothetical protein